jgi:hypothetical protein
MGLCMSAHVSFICEFSLLRLYIWKHSSVLFLSIYRMSIVCCMSRMCCEYLEFGLFDRIACICSLYLGLKFLPICPIYLC